MERNCVQHSKCRKKRAEIAGVKNSVPWRALRELQFSENSFDIRVSFDRERCMMNEEDYQTIQIQSSGGYYKMNTYFKN